MLAKLALHARALSAAAQLHASCWYCSAARVDLELELSSSRAHTQLQLWQSAEACRSETAAVAIATFYKNLKLGLQGQCRLTLAATK